MTQSNGIAVDVTAFNDSQLRISCAQAIIDALGIFILDCEEIPVSTELIHSALMGATILLEDASRGFCKKPIATGDSEVTA